jgi:hypothetical protein
MQFLRLNAKLWPPGPIGHDFRVLDGNQKPGQWDDLNLSLFKCVVVGIFQVLGLSSVCFVAKWMRQRRGAGLCPLSPHVDVPQAPAK